MPWHFRLPSAGTPENVKSSKQNPKVKSLNLKPCRHPLIHFQVLFGTIQGTSAFLVQHFPSGKVPDTVIEADLTELVVV